MTCRLGPSPLLPTMAFTSSSIRDLLPPFKTIPQSLSRSEIVFDLKSEDGGDPIGNRTLFRLFVALHKNCELAAIWRR
jgi:hypothetical protein